eukprot:UN25394
MSQKEKTTIRRQNKVFRRLMKTLLVTTEHRQKKMLPAHWENTTWEGVSESERTYVKNNLNDIIAEGSFYLDQVKK